MAAHSSQLAQWCYCAPQNHMLYLEALTCRQRSQVSIPNSIYTKTEGVFGFVCKYVYIYTHMWTCVHAHRKETELDKAALLSHPKCNSWWIVPGEWWMCSLPHSFPLHLCLLQSLATNAITVLNYLWFHNCPSVTQGQTKTNPLHQTASGTPSTDPT